MVSPSMRMSRTGGRSRSASRSSTRPPRISSFRGPGVMSSPLRSGAGHELVGEVRLDGLAVLHRPEGDQRVLGPLDILGWDPGERLALAALRRVEEKRQLENA